MKNNILNDIKEVFIGLLCIIGLISITGFIAFIIISSIHQSNDLEEKQFIDLQVVTMNGNGTVYYDRNTGVMYYRVGDVSFPILNKDGTPKLYLGDE